MTHNNANRLQSAQAQTANQAASMAVIKADRSQRQEYRAWLTLENAGGNFADGQMVSLSVRIANIGRTPAKNVEGDVGVYLMDTGEDPPFIYGQEARRKGYPSYHYSAKVIMHGASRSFPLAMAGHGKQGTANIIGSKEMHQRLEDRKQWMVMYGRFTYQDAFGEIHRVQFCDIPILADIVIGGTGKRHEAGVGNQKCGDYNDTD